MTLRSVGGYKYSTIFTDNWLHWRDVSLFAEKVNAARAFMLFKARVEKFQLKRDYKLMRVQRDCGEFTSNHFMHELALEAIELNLTAPYTPQQDGIAEKSNRIIAKGANTMIKWTNCLKLF